ncbi:MAG: glutamate 5-kinase, partial [Oscillospiraceae bacterium]
VLLSDIDGLYTANPHEDSTATLIPVVEEISKIEQLAGGSSSIFGKGGMITKVMAAKTVCSAGIDMSILNGAEPRLLYELFDGHSVGTHFVGRTQHV